MSLLRISLATIVVGGLLLGAGRGPIDVQAQPDSVRAEILKSKGFPPSHSPRGALWRTAAVPGWGQYYNRQYYKIPFVYAGLAGLGFLIFRANQQYRLFKRANLFVRGREMAGEDGTNEYSQFREQFEEVEALVGGRASRIRDLRDKYRRRRTLAILGTGLFYALTLVDAFVSAHLLTFDIDDDLAVRVQPTGELGSGRAPTTRAAPRAAAPEGQDAAGGIGLRVQVRF